MCNQWPNIFDIDDQGTLNQIIAYHNPIGIHYRVQSMRNCEDGAILELLSYLRLN